MILRDRRRRAWSPVTWTELCLSLGVLGLAVPSGWAQISYLGSGYRQDFDSLQGGTNNLRDVPWTDNTTLPGWYASRGAYSVTNGTLGGTATNFEDPAVAGNSGLFSFGPAASTDRALGTRANGDVPIRFGARLVNRTNQTFTRFGVAYIGEQWFRSSAGVPHTLGVDYQLGATGLDAGVWTNVAPLTFTSPSNSPAIPANINGNAAAGRSQRVGAVSGVAWQPGQELWLRFTDDDQPGPEHGLAADDFVFWTGEGSSLFFNGTNSHVTMGVAPALGLREFTVECWLLATGSGAATTTGVGGVTAVPLVAKGRAEDDGSNLDCNYFLGIDANGRLVADFEAAPTPGVNAGQHFPIAGRAILKRGSWYHAAVTYDGVSLRLYLNGYLEATVTPPPGTSPRFDSIQHFGIGTALNSTGVAGGFFQGIIDEVRVWQFARSADQIRANRDLPVTGSTFGLVARYAMDEGAEASLEGQISGAPSGTVRGAPVWVPGRRLVPNVPPTVALASPESGYVGMFPGTVPLVAQVEDTDGVVVKVEFQEDGVTLGEVSVPPFTYDWRRAAVGVHTLRVVAIDSAGDRTTSPAIAISVDPNPNQPPELELDAPAQAASVAGTSTMLRVALSDPEDDALRVTYFGRKSNPPSPGPDFVLGTLPDTQFYSENQNNRSAFFYRQTQWYVENRDVLNLAFITHMGDVVNNGDTDNGRSNLTEWQVADTAMKTIEDRILTLRPFGIPWGVAPGNHDQTPWGSATGTTTFFNQFFGLERFAGRPYYGGHYGSNNNNNYQFFSASGLDFIILHLEYDERAPESYQTVLDWADAVLAAHPDRRAIVTSHWVVNTGNPATFSTQGRAIYDRLKHHPSLFLLLGGHVAGEGRRTDVFEGRAVHSILQNYQGRANGGNGWLRYFVFSPANNTITAHTYSPSLNQQQFDSSGEFTLAYDMQSPVMPWVPLGTAAAARGAEAATLEWTGLEPGAHYEWYAAVEDEVSSTAVEARRFSTPSVQPPGVALTAPAAGFRTTMPATIRLAASVTNPSEEIIRVEFHQGNTKVGEATNPPYETTWSGPISGNYALTAIAVDRQGAFTVSPAVPITVVNPANQPPTVRLTAPGAPLRLLAPAAISLTATATDRDGAIAQVDFLAGSRLIGTRSLAPYTVPWNQVAAGDYTVTARATDNDGGVTVSAPLAVTIITPVVRELIPRNTVWKYRNDGVNLGTAWRNPGYDDSAWAAGPAELGYGDGDEATIVDFGPTPTNRPVTAYFRHAFQVEDPARLDQLALNLVRDDGAIVYLNGVEIGRSNMTAGVNYLPTGLAPTAVEGAAESTFFPLTFTTAPLPLLRRGTNTLAVEVHQRAIANPDLSFNLELLDRTFPVGRIPTVALTAPAPNAELVAPAKLTLAATAADPDGAVVKVEFFQNGAKIGETSREPHALSQESVGVGTYLLTAVATDNTGNSTRSAPVRVMVREADPGRFINFSLRSNVSSGSGTLIVGFATGGPGTQGNKPLLLRAVGPALAGFGITDFLSDPLASLYSGSRLLTTNDNWSGDAQISAVSAQVGAFPLGDPDSGDAAMVRVLPAGAYSLQIAGAGGIALAEVYDATPTAGITASTPRLTNLSVRALVAPNNTPLIAGVVVAGGTERTVLFRAVGPGLTRFGVTGVLADPQLEVYRAGENRPIANNRNWGGTAVLATAFARVGAFTLGAASRDAALLVRLTPGVYTARLFGPANATGIALIEIYDVP